MTATVAGTHLGLDTHANRPAANTAPDGSFYSCSTHSLIYKSNFAGNSWATWATLGSVGGSVATDTIWNAAGDLAQGTGSDTAARLALGTAGQVLTVNAGATAAEWAAGGTYSAWTPALTGSSSNPTLGSGSVAAGRYTQFGKHVSANARIAFGSSGTAAGSGQYIVSLPVTSVSTEFILGYGFVFDSSGATRRNVIAMRNNDTSVIMWFSDPLTDDTVQHNAPWAWAASDEIRLHFDYEAA